MTNKHPHDARIRAWLDGVTVQYQASGDIWIDLEPPTAEELPHFYRHLAYRRKPIVIRYRVAKMDSCVYAVSTIQAHDITQAKESFCEWLSDWVEVEV